MKKMLKRLCTGFLALATVVTALPTTPVHAESKQYWTESAERVGIIEKVMNDGSIGSTFNEGYMKVEGETAYCIDINTDFKNGYKTRADASSRMSADQISDVALSLEYVKQYGEAHKELNYNNKKRALQLSNPSNFRELVKKDCTLDLHLSILKYQEQSIELTRNEFRILYYFFMNEDKVISKEELLEKLWNDKYYIDENVLLVNMTRLKKKMKEIGIVHLLENIRGKGWKL